MTQLIVNATSPAGPSSGVPNEVLIVSICFALIIVVATSVIISLVLVLYCHYQYKYRRDSSKLGRFLSRAMSKPSNRIVHQNSFSFPTDLDGNISASCFQATYPDSKDVVYNTPQNTMECTPCSGYSGLSGVSHQEPSQHKMPFYETTLSAAVQISSTNTNPTYNPSNSNGHSYTRLSDPSDDPTHSRQRFRLTAEALSQFLQTPQIAVRNQNACVIGNQRSPRMHMHSHLIDSDTGYMSQSTTPMCGIPKVLADSNSGFTEDTDQVLLKWTILTPFVGEFKSGCHAMIFFMLVSQM